MRGGHDGRGELANFLRTRRARVRPEDVGVESFGRRRVPGLRREELAHLAGVSPAYYTRLEQGQSTNASESVIEALARALALTDDERSYLHELARPHPVRPRQQRRTTVASPGSQQLIAAMTDVPALVLSRHNDILAWNELAYFLLAAHYDREAPLRPTSRPNLTRMLFLDPHMRDFYRKWDEEARLAVASLRMVAGRFADDPALAALIGELTVKSADFASLWARHPVQVCTSGTKHLHHPEVGDVNLDYQALHLPDGSGHRIMTYTATPGSPSALALQLLRATPRPGLRPPSGRSCQPHRIGDCWGDPGVEDAGHDDTRVELLLPDRIGDGSGCS